METKFSYEISMGGPSELESNGTGYRSTVFAGKKTRKPDAVPPGGVNSPS